MTETEEVPAGEPTQAEIRSVCADIRKDWSTAEHYRRAGFPRYWLPPGCHRYAPHTMTCEERLHLTRKRATGHRPRAARLDSRQVLGAWLRCLLPLDGWE